MKYDPDPKLWIILPLPPEFRGVRHVSPCLAHSLSSPTVPIPCLPCPLTLSAFPAISKKTHADKNGPLPQKPGQFRRPHSTLLSRPINVSVQRSMPCLAKEGMRGGASAAGVPPAGRWHQGRRSPEDTDSVSRNVADSAPGAGNSTTVFKL